MPDYKKKRINRFKPAPRRKRALPTDEDIKMTPADKRRKKSEKPEKTPEMPLRVVNGKKLERRRKTGMFFSAALIIALILTVFQLVLPAGITENTENLISLIGKGSYPISLESTETQSAVSRGSYYYVLTDTRLNAFANGGKEIYSHSHGFENPVMKTSSTRALVFDQGGNEAYIYNLHELKSSINSDAEIINAAVSDSGVYAVVTRSESYASVVTVYSKRGKKIYTWYSSADTVNNVAVAPNGKKIAVSTFNSTNGKFVSKIGILNFDSANPISSVDVEGGPVITLNSFHRAGFIAATENKLYFINWSGKNNTEYKNDYTLSRLSAGSGGTVAVFNRENDRADNRIVLFGTNGQLKKEFEFKGTVGDIAVSGGHIYCISDTEVFLYGSDGKLLRKAECGFGGVKIAPLGRTHAAVITDNRIDRIQFE